jgi:hypothetical protein
MRGDNSINSAFSRRWLRSRSAVLVIGLVAMAFNRARATELAEYHGAEMR